MKRREFIKLIGGSVRLGRLRRARSKRRLTVSASCPRTFSRACSKRSATSFRSGATSKGVDISIELRNAAGHNERLPALADELLKLKVDVIVAVNTPAAQAAKKATKTVPVVMMRVADPVRSGLVASLARPGGNITGLSFMPEALGPKGVELLHEMLPKITRMAALYQGNNPGAVIIVDDVQRKGSKLD